MRKKVWVRRKAPSADDQGMQANTALQTRMTKKVWVRTKAPAADDQGMEVDTASAEKDDEHYGSWMDALHTITPILANPDLHSPEELITAIAKMLRLRGITMEVLRDTSVGAYVKDLCYHPSVQVSSAARIALDCFQTTLFEWADSVNWSTKIIGKACLEADYELRHRARVMASLDAIGSTKQPRDLRDDRSISNNKINNICSNTINDYDMPDVSPPCQQPSPSPGISKLDINDPSGSSSYEKDLTGSSTYEEDSLYTPSEPSLLTQLPSELYTPSEPSILTQPPEIKPIKPIGLHVHFPISPVIPLH